MQELWNKVPGYEGYEASNTGKIRSIRFNRLKELKAATHHDGYSMVCLHVNKVQLTSTVHKLVMLAFAGPKPHGLEVRHIDGNPKNNHLSNLNYSTRKENQHDRIAHGTTKRGKGSYKDSLDQPIIEMVQNNCSRSVIAEALDVCIVTVTNKFKRATGMTIPEWRKQNA